ncbi:MAG: hypothetical protein LBV31_01800, partial [Prevotellaceae bacterium]|nr:hypothetical protein [Prevotellaceae bacterium]
MKKLILTAALFAATVMGVNAQVTIGSGTPPHAGALLELTNATAATNGYSTKGLLLPRVALSNATAALPGDAATAKGMVVYNITEDPENGLTEGLYIWTEERTWTKLVDDEELTTLKDNVDDLIGTSTASKVGWENTVEKRTLYLDTNADAPIPGVPNSIFNPYKTWGTLITDTKYSATGANLDIVIAPGSDLSAQDITITDLHNVTIHAESTPDATTVKIGNLTIAGTTSNFAISGIDITGNLVMTASGDDISFVNSHITGSVSANPSSGSGEPLRAFYHCTIDGSINLSGTGSALYYFENCWASENSSNTCILNNTNGRLQLVGCEGFKVYRKNGKVSVRESILYGYQSDNTAGENFLYSGIVINPVTKALDSIKCDGTAKLLVGSLQYRRAGSTRAGVWLDSGIGTEQVRSNVDFTNIPMNNNSLPVNSEGSNRTVANTVKDVLKAIDIKLGELAGIAAGAQFTIQDGPDNTTIQFVNTEGEEIYSFAKPEPVNGSSSILVSGGVASVRLDADSPVTQAINAAVTQGGKGLSTNDYTTDDMSKLRAMPVITSVNNANGLTLNNGVLGLEDLLGRIYPVGTIYETTNPEF